MVDIANRNEKAAAAADTHSIEVAIAARGHTLIEVTQARA